MAELSPAAQAVMDAADIGFSTPSERIAAALRAAADQCAEGMTHFNLYVIAAELEGADD